uniref:Uncharacterized protein n=1 Tax=Ixodes ricinus TaxID=34613 RepID=A0A6B0ULQ3_IXORI
MRVPLTNFFFASCSTCAACSINFRLFIPFRSSCFSMMRALLAYESATSLASISSSSSSIVETVTELNLPMFFVCLVTMIFLGSTAAWRSTPALSGPSPALNTDPFTTKVMLLLVSC